MLSSLRDLLPILVEVAFFQLVVLQQPIPNLFDLVVGTLFVLLGLTFFIYGLETSLFPLGEAMAYAFAKKGSVFWLLLFGFALGFGTTIAEPALIAVADEASKVMAQGEAIPDTETARETYARATGSCRPVTRARCVCPDGRA